MPRTTQQMMIMIFFCTREAGRRSLSQLTGGAGGGVGSCYVYMRVKGLKALRRGMMDVGVWRVGDGIGGG